MTSHQRSSTSLPAWLALAILTATVCQGAPLKDVKPSESERSGGKRPEIMSGSFSGMVAPLFLPPGVVRSWLPPGLQLASECPYAARPVIVMFGSIDDLAREKLVTVKPRFGRHFLETFVAVPYLRLEAAPRGAPVFHFVRVYTDSLKGTTKGIRQSGWPKIYTPIATTDETYRITPDGAGTILGAQMDYAHLKPVGAGNHSLRQVEAMLSQPLVLRHEGVYNIYSFDFHFDKAALTSMPVSLEIREGFMPQLGPMKGKMPGIADSDFGAFHLACRYTKVPRE
jgi:hypothetical protein